MAEPNIEPARHTGLKSPYASVRLEYESRPDIILGYIAGRQIGDSLRLKRIKACVGETVARTYTLQYTEREYNSRSILTSLLEADTNEKAYPPLIFEYSNPPGGWDLLDANTWAPPAVVSEFVNANWAPPKGTGFVDLDGDGRPDFIQYHVSGNTVERNSWLNKPTQGWVLANGGNGMPDYRLPIGAVLAQDNMVSGNGTRIADINADGLPDVVISGEGRIFLNSGAGFSESARWNIPPTPPPSSGWVDYGPHDFIDVNGDGLTDCIFRSQITETVFIINEPTEYYYYDNSKVLINRGPGADQTPGAGWEVASNSGYGSIVGWLGNPQGTRFLDVNGDGLPEMVRSTYSANGSWYERRLFRNTGSGWDTANNTSSPWLLPEVFSVNLNSPPYQGTIGTEVVDINGDGLPDTIRRYDQPPHLANQVNFNTGNGWVAAGTSYNSPIVLAWDYKPGCGLFIDFNNDGRVDIGYANQIQLGTPSGWTPADTSQYYLPHFVGQPYSQGYYGNDFIDLNGDGAVDQLWNFKLHGSIVEKGAGINRRTNPDRLTKVTNGLGVSVAVNYAPLTERDPVTGTPTVYTKGSGAVYPVADIIAPLYVVKAVNSDDGVGGQYRIDYTYGSYRTHAERGSLGFGLMSVYDTRTQIATTTYFSQEYPFAGSPIKTETVYEDGSANGVKLSESTVTYDQKLLNNGKTRFIFAKSSHEKAYNFDTPAAEDILTESATITYRGSGTDYDSYGNSLYLSVTTSGAGGIQPHSKVTTSTYDNIVDAPSSTGASRWYLGRLTASSVTATSPTNSQVRSSSFTYYNTTTGLLKTETIEPGSAALSVTTTYGHDTFGNKTTVTTSGASVTSRSASTTYDTQGRFPQRTLNALGHEETYTYDSILGVLLSTTGPNSLTTSWEYDGFARKIKETRADGTISLMHYRWTAASNGIPADAKYHIETESSGTPPAIAFYDSFGRTIAAYSINGGGFDGNPRIVGSETFYDSMGRAYRSSLLHYLNAPPSEIFYTETSNYDALGRPRTLAAPSDEVAGGIAYSYIAYNGFTIETTNPKGQVERVGKNAQGQVVERINNATATTNSDERGRVTFTYDAYGQLLTTVVHKNDSISHTTTLEYDARGRKTKMIDPDMGTWEYGYNVFGELIWQKDAKARYTTMGYDELGRLVERREYTSQSAIDPVITTWTYDSAPGASLGKLHTVVTTGASHNKSVGNNETYSYDSLGRPANVTRSINGRSYTSGQTYDSLGRPQYTIYPSGFQTKNVYSLLGFLREVRRADNGQNELYWAADSYALDGRVNGEYYGNGLSTDRVYNQRTGRLEMVHSGVGADARAQYLRYTYDVLGNVLSRADDPLKRSETFTYDGLNRLTAHSDRNTQTNATTTVSVAYDSLGNIREKSDVGTYHYNNPRPHAVSDTTAGPVSSSYTYDDNGNMVTGGGRAYSWTLDNKPWRIEQGAIWSEFTFDSSRQRTTQKTNLGTTTYYVGGAYEEVRSGSNDSTLVERKHYIMAPTGRVALRVEKNSGIIVETRWFHQDGLGSINAISKENGEIVQRFAYDAWGKRVNGENGSTLTSSSNQGFTRGYTDHEHLEDLGLIHMNGRVYDSTLGRFISADSCIDNAGDVQSHNRYSYVNNNPLRHTDPSGYFKFKDLVKIVAVIVVAVVAAYFLGPVIANGMMHTVYGAGYGVLAPSITAVYGAVGAGIAGGFASGFAGSLLNGGSLGDAFKAGLIGGAIGGIAGFAGARAIRMLPENSFLATNSIPQAATEGFVNGATAGALDTAVYGGNLGENIARSAFTSSAAYGGGESIQTLLDNYRLPGYVKKQLDASADLTPELRALGEKATKYYAMANSLTPAATLIGGLAGAGAGYAIGGNATSAAVGAFAGGALGYYSSGIDFRIVLTTNAQEGSAVDWFIRQFGGKTIPVRYYQDSTGYMTAYVSANASAAPVLFGKSIDSLGGGFYGWGTLTQNPTAQSLRDLFSADHYYQYYFGTGKLDTSIPRWGFWRGGRAPK